MPIHSKEKAKDSMIDEFTNNVIQDLKTWTVMEKLGHTNYKWGIQDDFCLERVNTVILLATLQSHYGLKALHIVQLGIVKTKACG